MVVDETHFLADQDLSPESFISPRSLRIYYKDLFTDKTFADLQAGIHGWNDGVELARLAKEHTTFVQMKYHFKSGATNRLSSRW